MDVGKVMLNNPSAGFMALHVDTFLKHARDERMTRFDLRCFFSTHLLDFF